MAAKYLKKGKTYFDLEGFKFDMADRQALITDLENHSRSVESAAIEYSTHPGKGYMSMNEAFGVLESGRSLFKHGTDKFIETIAPHMSSQKIVERYRRLVDACAKWNVRKAPIYPSSCLYCTLACCGCENKTHLWWMHAKDTFNLCDICLTPVDSTREYPHICRTAETVQLGNPSLRYKRKIHNFIDFLELDQADASRYMHNFSRTKPKTLLELCDEVFVRGPEFDEKIRTAFRMDRFYSEEQDRSFTFQTTLGLGTNDFVAFEAYYYFVFFHTDEVKSIFTNDGEYNLMESYGVYRALMDWSQLYFKTGKWRFYSIDMVTCPSTEVRTAVNMSPNMYSRPGFNILQTTPVCEHMKFLFVYDIALYGQLSSLASIQQPFAPAVVQQRVSSIIIEFFEPRLFQFDDARLHIILNSQTFEFPWTQLFDYMYVKSLYVPSGFPHLPLFNYVMKFDIRDHRRPLSKLEREYFTTNTLTRAECPICQDSKLPCNRILLNCGHPLHEHCLVSQTQLSPQPGLCPLCRTPIRFGPIDNLLTLPLYKPDVSSLSREGGIDKLVIKNHSGIDFFECNVIDRYTTSIAAIYLMKKHNYRRINNPQLMDLTQYLIRQFYKHPEVRRVQLPGLERCMFPATKERPLTPRARLREFLTSLRVPDMVISFVNWTAISNDVDTPSHYGVFTERDDEPRTTTVLIPDDFTTIDLFEIQQAESLALLDPETAHVLRQRHLKGGYFETTQELGAEYRGIFATSSDLPDSLILRIMPGPEAVLEVLNYNLPQSVVLAIQIQCEQMVLTDNPEMARRLREGSHRFECALNAESIADAILGTRRALHGATFTDRMRTLETRRLEMEYLSVVEELTQLDSINDNVEVLEFFEPAIMAYDDPLIDDEIAVLQVHDSGDEDVLDMVAGDSPTEDTDQEDA